MQNIGFDNDKYLRLQSEHIRKRISDLGGKLYLEFGGKLFDDYHAARVLPGFQPNSKIRMLQTLKDDVEIVLVISATDIENSKIRADLGITYEDDILRLIDVFRDMDLYVGSVVVTFYAGQPTASSFIARLNSLGIKTWKHYPIPGYPSDVRSIVSENGYGINDYIETDRSLVVVTAPGPGSGKMAVCLSQLYQEHMRGVKAGYAKYETFPIWNLPLKHPVNLAYEAATADLNDVNMIDPFHLEAYGQTAVNYNRDVEIFPVLKTMFQKIYGDCPYKSPTDMGVNMAGFCISDDEVCCIASKKEIMRRHLKAQIDFIKGLVDESVVRKTELLVNQAEITDDICPAIAAALEKEKQTGGPAGALALPDGKIITGKTSALLGAASALLLNALKYLADIDDDVDLISPQIIEPVCNLKTEILGHRNPRLHSNEILMALCICAVSNPLAKKALDQLPKLVGCDVHFSVIISETDEQLFRQLGTNISCQPVYEMGKLFHKKS